MFTGLVEGQGIVRAARPAGDALRLDIEIPGTMRAGDSGQLGESVAINGCCLTVVSLTNSLWSFEAGAETLSKTTLGELTAGSSVNLERALSANGRFGGHIVQGHVDGLACVREVTRHGDWTDMTFRLPSALAGQLVAKGSVAVDGVSLTVVTVDDGHFSIALIPHTLQETNLGRLTVGDRVNIETDILGKYVQKMLAARFGEESASFGRG
jgi:riboflavin synthase